jgi:Zn-dependent peptidase ImmA (M78 family)
MESIIPPGCGTFIKASAARTNGINYAVYAIEGTMVARIVHTKVQKDDEEGSMPTSVTVAIPPRILDWVVSIGDNDRLNDSQMERLERWRSTEANPNISDIREFSKKLHVPFGYFFLNEPVNDTPPLFAHRTVGSQEMTKPSRNLVDTIHEMSNLQDWARQDLIDTKQDTLNFVDSKRIDSDPAKLAESIRGQLELSKDWYQKDNLSEPHHAFNYLRERIESARIIVMMSGVVGNDNHRRLDPTEFRAFALIDEFAPLIFINRADEPESARLFSMLHELAHIWLGENELFNVDNEIQPVGKLEQLCNSVASELLMPDEAFMNAWGKTGEDVEKNLESIKDAFPVSWTAVAVRALKHGLIDKEQYDHCADQAREWDIQRPRSGSGGNYYNTKMSRFDHRLLEHITTSLYEGRTQYTEAFRMTGTNRKTFAELLQRSGL